MIRLLSDVGGPGNVAALMYPAIAAAVTVGVLVGVAMCWLTSAADGGE